MEQETHVQISDSESENRTDAHKGQPGEKLHPGRQIPRDLLKGLLFTVIVLALKLYVEQTAFGRQLQVMTYTLLQLRLSSEDANKKLPVAIVDISDLKPVPYTTGKWTRMATPREPLLKIIDAAARQGAKAIGVDIDFAPDQPGYMTPGDPEFFQACLDIRNKTKVPIFLGTQRSQDLEPKLWLSSEDYKDLAVSVTVLRHDNRKMPKWIQRAQDSEHGITMSAALASALQPSDHTPPEWLGWAVEQISEKRLERYGLIVGEYLVDYSLLDTFKGKALQTTKPEVISDQGRLLRDKIVLIGDGTLGKGTDTFLVPGQTEPVPGVYLHACAAYTLTKPLYELTPTGRLAVDLILSVAIIASIASIRLYYKTKEVDTQRLQGFFTFLVVLAAYFVGVVFVRTTRVMWDDFILAITALLLHPAIERNIEKGWELMRSKLLPSFRNAISK
jgi:CHASE2 domain-containing sensor protein